MLLKILVYGYVTNVYSSRKLEIACKENINFMWLSAMNYPDHNTINRFRGVRLKDALRAIFEQVVKLLVQEGLISIEEIYTDGTKIEANANKYTFVWKKSIQTNKEKMKKQLAEIWEYAQTIADKEDSLPDPPDFTTIDSEKVKDTVEKLNKVLNKNKQASNKTKAKMRYISKNFVENIEKYETQEEILGERNSYSKTDPEATFIVAPSDHLILEEENFQNIKNLYKKRKSFIKWSEEFDEVAKANILLNYAYKKEVFPIVHEFKTGENIKTKLPKSYYNYRKKIDVNTETKFINELYDLMPVLYIKESLPE